MKKNNIIKKLISILLIVFLSVNTYATQSSNDGSSFITKAEFDSLISKFSEQMDVYRAGLNAKIDTAIASYIGGLSGESVTNASILLSNWSEISAFNGVYDPTFKLPEVDVFYGGGLYGTYNWGGNKKKFYSVPFMTRITYKPSETQTAYRPLFTSNKSENNQSTSDVKKYWNGVATNYYEKFVINAGLYYTGTKDLAYGENDPSANTKTLKMLNPVNWEITEGYNPNFATDSNCLKTTFYWKGNTIESNFNFTTKSANNVAQVELKTDGSNKTKIYEHIIQYDGNDAWCISNETFTKTFRVNTNDGTRSATLLSGATKNDYSSQHCTAAQTNDTGNQWNQGETISGLATRIYNGARTAMTINYETNNSIAYPRIGMQSAEQTAKTLYLTDETISYAYKTAMGTVDALTLEKGFPLLYAPGGSKVTWKPFFKKGKMYSESTSSWIDSTATTVKLMLSKGPFSDKIASTNIIKGESAAGTTTDGGVICKVDEAQEITFTMPSDGIAWAKWVPDTGDYDEARWIQPLDLSKCFTYQVKESQ